jgi:hypothetical protein
MESEDGVGSMAKLEKMSPAEYRQELMSIVDGRSTLLYAARERLFARVLLETMERTGMLSDEGT